VNAAQPGDLVEVGPGLYRESVVVPPGKERIRIEGAATNTTTLDPVPLQTGVGFAIFAPGVEVRGFRVRGGRSAVMIGLDAAETVIQGMRLMGSRIDSAIIVGGARSRILDNELLGAADNGVELIYGTVDCVIAGNRITQARGGIHGEAVHRIEIRGNEILSAGSGIVVTGDDVHVMDNGIVDVSQHAVSVEGARPLVFENGIRNTGPSHVTCTECESAQVFGNRSHSVQTRQCCDAIGWDLTADTPGLRVVTNYVSRAGAFGYLVRGSQVLLDNNRSIETATGPGFWIHLGRGHLLRGNSAIRSAGSGFFVTGTGTTLERNFSSEARASGFLVGQLPAIGTRLADNVAARSLSAGFAVLSLAEQTVLAGNRGAANRYDFCDEGTGTDASGGNLFATMSTVCDLAH
jgi:hypothetical protein